jgi:hypothetical protein
MAVSLASKNLNRAVSAIKSRFACGFFSVS